MYDDLLEVIRVWQSFLNVTKKHNLLKTLIYFL